MSVWPENSVGRKFGWVEEHASGMSDHRKLYVLSCIGNCYLLNILNGCHHWKWFKEIVSVGNMMKQEKLRLVLLYWKLLSSWMLLLECFETNFVSVLSVLACWRKMWSIRRSLCWILLSLEHTWWASSLKMFQKNYLCMKLQLGICFLLIIIRWVLHYKMIQRNCISTSALS